MKKRRVEPQRHRDTKVHKVFELKGQKRKKRSYAIKEIINKINVLNFLTILMVKLKIFFKNCFAVISVSQSETYYPKCIPISKQITQAIASNIMSGITNLNQAFILTFTIASDGKIRPVGVRKPIMPMPNK